MKKLLSTCRGWAISCRVTSHGDANVSLNGVCTGRWHKECASRKECEALFAFGGNDGAHKTLARLKGLKKVPKSWESRSHTDAHYKLLSRLDDEMRAFSKAYFKKCKPVTVQIYKR